MTAPRPEFGKPETGLVRHWFRTDAQMRRHYMDPEQRELERQRLSARRAMMKKHREEAKVQQVRYSHRHFFCTDCSGGLHDVGVIDGEGKRRTREDVESLLCCICLVVVLLGPKRSTVAAKWGPNRNIFRCRVLDPDVAEVES
jgi:hypothetical protein